MRPVLDGNYWLIGPSPDLGDQLPGDEAHRLLYARGEIREHNAPVDHHITRDAAGRFHLWGCVRATDVGRVLYHWTSDDLTQSPWESTGEVFRADPGAGECVDDWMGQEWLQSPFFVHDEDTWYMFYGGHRTGRDLAGTRVGPPPDSGPGLHNDPSTHQICLMTSSDGVQWSRHRNADGSSRLFTGPGEARDPCVINIDGLWHMYYAGYYDTDRADEGAGFVVRTSEDLLKWSDWRLVHRDPSFGVSRTDTECPFVTFRDGYYYLFRTVDYYRSLTYVFRSEDPFDFGVGDARAKLVGRLPCAAPELYTFDGQEYISSSHNPHEGEMLCRLRWEPDE